MKTLISLALLIFLSPWLVAQDLPRPPDVWKDYNPDQGDFKEQIVLEETKDGIYYKEAYISAYVNGIELRIFCKYAVKAGAKKAPGLMNTHGWMGGPSIDFGYVKEGWAVLSHDYSGLTKRAHHTKYPDSLGHGHMDARDKGFKLIYDRMPDGSQMTDPKATSHYLWNAIQRRALSYLLAQKEVDSTRIGAKGYSYGGTIMWNLAMDARVKAVVAYFGIGWITYYRDRAVWKYNLPFSAAKKSSGQELFLSAVAPQAHAPDITAATLWLSGTNDHHGGHERGCDTFKSFKADTPWDFAMQARGHHNTEKLGDDTKIWLEKHVLGKDRFWPQRAKSKVVLNADGVPELHLTPGNPGQIKSVEIYKCLKTANNIARVWSDVESTRVGNTWVAKLAVFNLDDYLFSYANIRYKNNTVVSSDFEAVIPESLGKAVANAKKSEMISEGTGQWKDVGPAEGVGGVKGFRPLNNRLGTYSRQFADPQWQAPRKSDLSFKFYCTQPQKLKFAVNKKWEADIEMTASNDWQTMIIPADQMRIPAKQIALKAWSIAEIISIKALKGADITKVIFADFKWVASTGTSSKAPVKVVDGKVYLNQYMASKTETFWQVMDDKSVEGIEKISVGGVTYDRGLGVHANSKIVFPLDGEYLKFHVVPGPDDVHNGTVEMKILLDGKQVFSSGLVNSATYKAKPISLSVKGAKELTLIVTDGGNGKGGDHASWADAYLIPAK